MSAWVAEIGAHGDQLGEVAEVLCWAMEARWNSLRIGLRSSRCRPDGFGRGFRHVRRDCIVTGAVSTVVAATAGIANATPGRLRHGSPRANCQTLS